MIMLFRNQNVDVFQHFLSHNGKLCSRLFSIDRQQTDGIAKASSYYDEVDRIIWRLNGCKNFIAYVRSEIRS